VLLALHVEHPVGNVVDLLRCQGMGGRLVAGLLCHEGLALAPDAVVATTVEGHRRRGELSVLVKGHRLSQVGGSPLGNVILGGTRRHRVTNRPAEANPLRATQLVESIALRVGLLSEVRLEGLAEGTEAFLRSGRHVVLCNGRVLIKPFQFFLKIEKNIRSGFGVTIITKI